MVEIQESGPGFSFTGRVALVTGAGRGIGAAIARELHGAGAKVVVTDKDVDYAEAVAKELDPGGETAIALKLDVRLKQDFETALTTAMARWSRLDIVVNNAGFAKRTPIDEITPEEFDEIVAIN